MITLFSGDTDEKSAGPVLIRSKALLLCLGASCYLFVLYRYGLFWASVTAPIFGLTLGNLNRRFAHLAKRKG
jgi:hypothetical protein